MREAISFITLLIVSLYSFAQTFQNLYGDTTVNDAGHSLLQTNDGGFIIAGTQYTPGNYVESLFFIRTDPHGDTLWTRRIKESSVNYSGLSLVNTFDAGFAVVGIKSDGSYSIPFLLKIDSSGNLLWNHSYLWFAEEQLNSVVQTPDSGYLLSGYLYNGIGDMLVYFVRTDGNGDTLWTKSYGETNFNTQVYSLKIAADGGYIAAGFIQDQLTQNVDAYIFKTDAAGNFLWSKGYGTANYEYAQQIEVTSDNGIALAAVTYSGNGAEYCLIKTDSSGNLQWSKTYGGVSDDRSEAIHQTNDDGYLISGESSSFSFGNFDNYFVRTDSNGDTLWTKTIHGLQNNEGYSMIITDDGGFAVTGDYFAHPTNNDVFFLKADSTGYLGCGELSTNTSIGIPSLTVTSHSMAFYSTQPSVVTHLLEVKSGTGISPLCETDKITEKNEPVITFYPNPVTNQLYVSFIAGVHSTSEVRVFNLFGSEIKVHVKNHLDQLVIDCSQLGSGMYILEVWQKKGVSFQKFLKE